MAVTPQQFFSNNMKWCALAFFILFLFKSVQSCNRNMGTVSKEKEYKNTIDSLTKKVHILENDNKQLSFELQFQTEKAEESERRAIAIQSVAEKIKSNTTTTVNVRGAEVDTIKRK